MTPEPIAVLQGLDKVAAKVSQIVAPVGSSVTFGTLSILVRDCETAPPDAPPDNAAFIQIYETPPGEQTKRLFSGWMFSSSPALSGLEHPVYDVTLLACKAASAPAPAPPPPASPPPASAPKPGGKTPR
ncbi:MAG TPA: DUF2155 domain-containing protein [Stellaceae bacterium]|nr:DUF2155 domain-containing protein [Stellaceae bacterium]